MYPLLRITPNWALPTYLVVISLTYCLCIYLVYRRAQNIGAVKFDLSIAMALDICLAIMIGGFIGARLMHVLYEEPGYYFEKPWRVFEIWQGGFVYYGGLFGALIASFAFIRYKKESFTEWANFFAPILALGYALGRIGCFLNGCCYGRVCALPWAVTFHTAEVAPAPRHPTQLYATFWELGVFIALLALEKRKARNLFMVWLTLHAIGRLIMEHFRDDDRGPILLNMSVSTWLSLAILVYSAGFFIRHKRKT